MDYHVFILSRIREAFDRGMTTEDAVAHGIKSTAGVVTSAALVMFGVFAIFATLQFMFLKQFGVGLAVAVLVDATIVRAVLLPATMKLLGDWNWYLPKWLEWLPRLEHGDSQQAAEFETPTPPPRRFPGRRSSSRTVLTAKPPDHCPGASRSESDQRRSVQRRRQMTGSLAPTLEKPSTTARFIRATTRRVAAAQP